MGANAIRRQGDIYIRTYVDPLRAVSYRIFRREIYSGHWRITADITGLGVPKERLRGIERLEALKVASKELSSDKTRDIGFLKQL